jgi:hypothetical protein
MGHTYAGRLCLCSESEELLVGVAVDQRPSKISVDPTRNTSSESIMLYPAQRPSECFPPYVKFSGLRDELSAMQPMQ